MAFFRKAVLVNSAALIGIVISIFQTVIVTRVLGPQGIGQYSLILASLMLVTQLSSFGLPLSYLYHSQKEPEANQRYLMNATWSTLISGSIGGAVLALIIYLNPEYFGTYPFWIYLVILAHIPVVIYSMVARNDLMILIQARRLSLMKLAMPLAHVTFVAFFYFMGYLTVNAAIFCFFLIGFLRLILGAYWIREKLTLDILPGWKTIKSLSFMGIRLSWADLAVLLNGKISLLIIRHVLDDFEQVGYFSRGQRIALLVITAGQAVLPLLFSRWAAIEEGKLAENVQRVLRFSFAMVAVMVAGIILFGRWILVILYGQEFLPALLPMRILIPGIGLYLISRALTQLLGSRGRPEIAAMFIFTASAVTAVLSLAMTPVWSIAGAAIAELIGHIILLGLLLAYVCRVHQVNFYKSVFINRNDLKTIYRQLLTSPAENV